MHITTPPITGFLSCIALLSFLAGCATAPVTIGPGQSASGGGYAVTDDDQSCSDLGKPGWVVSPNQDNPGTVYSLGTSLQSRSRRNGREQALDDAATRLSARMGGGDLVREQYIAEEYCERHGSGVDYWVLLAVPRKVFATSVRRFEGRVAVGSLCPRCPGDRWLQETMEGLSQVRQTLAPGRLSPAQAQAILDGDFSDLAAVAESFQAWRAVVVKVEVDRTEVQDDIHYVWLRAVMQVVDMDGGKVCDTYSTDVFKGASFNGEADAMDIALEEVAQDLKIHLGEVTF